MENKTISKNIQHIIIVGGGTAGWVTASILAKALLNTKAAKQSGQQYEISLIESTQIGTIGVGEATIPPIISLFEFLEIDRKKLLKKVDGTYKYGIEFDGWATPESKYLHAFGEIGMPAGGQSFSSLWLSGKAQNIVEHLSHYSPTTQAAYQNKFHPPLKPFKNDDGKFYPLASMQYAYQFDANKLIAELKRFSLELGVCHITGTIDTFQRSKANQIVATVLQGGEIISGDFFVDCSGIKGIINRGHYQCEFLDWSNYLPCDSAIPIQTEKLNPLSPFTKSIAMSSGWRWQIPLQSRTGNGYVYSSRFIDDEAALREFENALEPHKRLSEARILKFKTGCISEAWCENSVAIGLSSGFFEPLESTSIHLIHKFAARFCELLVDRNLDQVQKAKSFNSEFMETAESIRDFLVLHYHVNQRQDSAFWEYCRNMTIPNSLQEKLSEYRDNGHITLPENSLFTFENYFQVLVGQNYLSNYQKFAKPNMNQQRLSAFFSNVEKAIQIEVEKLESHELYLQKT